MVKTRTRPITDREKLFIGQKMMLLRHLELYPTGILSEVMDTYDIWQVLTEILPDPEVKQKILARDGKLVIRPDSGDPVDIICGTHQFTDRNYKLYNTPQKKGVIQLLWEAFGGKINEYGYKELDSHIGAIYGDSITLDRAKQICERLKAKGFASTNIVFGVGSFTYQYNTRDTFGFAMKATYGEVEENFLATAESVDRGTRTVSREIFKDPVTDDGTKKSAKGLLMVSDADENRIKLFDQVPWGLEKKGLLQTVFLDGKLTKTYTLDEIRKNIKQSLW